MSASSTECGSGFVRYGPAAPTHPVVVAVPHAGRAYPPALLAQARVAKAVLEGLEDRLCDLLATGAVADGATVFVARAPRAWLDLNRGERELDRAMLSPPPPPDAVEASVKVRGGLGLVPRRGSGGAELWRGRIAAADIGARVAALHRPWHAAIATALAAAHARFGVAVLLDLHSMPPLPGDGAAIVLGDRFGASADERFVACVERTAAAAGRRSRRNAPYPGGHTLDRHGTPGAGRHALQLEIDRALYLDAGLRRPGTGLAATRRLVTAIVRALADETTADALPLAAE